MKTIGYNRISSNVIVVPDDAEILPRERISIKPHILHEGEEKKHCCGCDEWLPLNHFHKHYQNHDRLQSFCKECVRERQTTARMG